MNDSTPQRERKRIPVTDRFWRHVTAGAENECWLWQGATIKGYGALRMQRSHSPGYVYAHRMSYEIHKGAIPADQHVCHSCDNPLCVNPNHLWVGTNRENVTDMDAKGRRVTQRGETHPDAKLTEAQVLEIRERAANGEKQRNLASEYSISESNISSIVTRRVWKHL